MRSARWLKAFIAAGEDEANSARAGAQKTFDKMSELRPLVKKLNQTVGGKRVCVAGLIDAVLVHIQSVITSSLSESEDIVSKVIRHRRDSFPVAAFSETPGPSARSSSDQA